MDKKHIILIAIVVVYFIIFLLVGGLGKNKKDEREALILIDNETAWKLENNSWINIKEELNANQLNESMFTVFVNNKNIGNYYLEKSSNWILYDSSWKQYNYELVGNFLAIRANYEVNIQNFRSKTITETRYVNKVLKDNNLTDITEFTVNNQYEIDIDSDGRKENIYTISNAFARETSPKQVFSIVFMEKDNQIYYLYNSIEKNDGQNGCKPYINTILDLDNDQKYEIILSCGYYSVQNRNDMLFSFDEAGFRLITQNKQ